MSSFTCGRMHSAIVEGGERRIADELGESLVEVGCDRYSVHETARCEKCDGEVVLKFKINGWFWKHEARGE